MVFFAVIFNKADFYEEFSSVVEFVAEKCYNKLLTGFTYHQNVLGPNPTPILNGEIIVRDYVIMLLIWNLIIMLIYGVDKMQAKIGGRRIRETTLLVCAFLFGGVGAMFGMILFNHKTSKIKFRTLVPTATVLGLVEIYLFARTLPL